MKKTPRPLLVFHEDRILRERLRTVAASRSLGFRTVADWEALFEEMKTTPASALVVVDPYAETTGLREPSIELAALLNRFPSVAVTAALVAGPGRLEHVRKLGEWGVVQVIDLEEEMTAVAMAQRLLAAQGKPLRNLLERALPPHTPGAARSILAASASVISEGGQGAELARSLHITARTLTRWCRRAGLPPPKRLLAWMRILLAAEMLDDPGRTVSDVALSCGYAADSSLRHVLRSFVGMNPTELRGLGAFEVTSRTFLRALAEARSAGKRYRAARVAPTD